MSLLQEPEFPRDLIAENSEAQKYVQDMLSQIDKLKLFPNEHFVEVIGNVLSGTGLDLQGESAQVRDLEKLVAAVQRGDFWVRRAHDPLIHPIGRVIAAKVFRAVQPDIFFVVGIIGFYDASELPTFASSGIDVSKLPVPLETATDDPTHLYALMECNPLEIPNSLVADMLATAPDTVARGEGVHFRKEAVSLAILHLSVSFWLLSNTPFGKKFQERLGEKAADASADFLKWIAQTVCRKLRQITGRETRLVISFQHKGCEVEFVLKGNEGPLATTEAMQAMEAAANQSLLLVEALLPSVPTRVTYGYDLPTKRWFPIHATTRKVGIITDQPYLITTQNLQGGFSVGGRRLPLYQDKTETK
jgi:hypothetical protein